MSKKYSEEFEEFMNPERHVAPSHQTSLKALNFVRGQLSPSDSLIFLKLALLQFFFGLLTTTLCPQFNLSLTNNHELFHFFHRNFGPHICMALCGAIFMGSATIASAYLLKENEVLRIQRSRFLHLFFLSGTSVCGFILLGADVYLHTVPFWMFGGVFFGAIFLNLNFKMKRSFS